MTECSKIKGVTIPGDLIRIKSAGVSAQDMQNYSMGEWMDNKKKSTRVCVECQETVEKLVESNVTGELCCVDCKKEQDKEMYADKFGKW